MAEQLGLGRSEGDSSSSSKKQKKHKKHKKESKKKKRKLSPSDSEHSSSEEVWVERVASAADGGGVSGPVGQRQSWMELPGVTTSQTGLGPEQGTPAEEDEGDLLQCILQRSSVRVKEADVKKKAEEKEALLCVGRPGSHPKELNPYWREGGGGLPEKALKGHDRRDHEGSSVGTGRRESGRDVVGDGGRSWVLKSYKRALEQSKSEGRAFEDVARERWGSMEELHSLLTKAGVDPRNPHRALAELSNPARHSRDRGERDREGPRPGSSRDDRYQDISFNQSKRGHSFHRPGEERDQRHSKHFAGLGSQTDSAPKDGWRKAASRESSGNRRQDAERSPPTSSSLTAPPTESTSGGAHQVEAHHRPPSQGAPQPLAHGERPRVPPRAVADEGEGELQVEAVTDAQLNALGAKLMKAELMGNATKVAALKSELDRLRALKEKQGEAPRGGLVCRCILSASGLCHTSYVCIG